MKKKLLVCFMIVLFLVLGHGITKNENHKIATMQENEIIEEACIESIEDEEEKETEIVVPEIETKIAEESKPLEETKDDTVSSVIEDKKITEIKTETKKEKNNNTDNQKVVTKATNMEIQPVIQDTTEKTIIENIKKEEKTQEIVKCKNNNHSIDSGNSNRWFNTEEELENFYNIEIKKWSDEWTSGEIERETYYENCPYGYEDWSCPLCGMWTINFYYR